VCEPATIMMAMTAASTAVKAYSAIQQGRAQYQADMFNAQLAQQNAQRTEDQQAKVDDAAALERRALGDRIRAERAEGRVKAGGMGIDAFFGTPGDLDASIAATGYGDLSIMGKNQINAKQQLDVQKADFLDSAMMSRSSAKGALKAGYLGATGELLQGGANISEQWIQTHPQTPKPGPTNQVNVYKSQPIKVGGEPAIDSIFNGRAIRI